MSDNLPLVHVAVGVVIDNDHNILLAKRQAHQHLAGLWEFPGGKVEAEESVYQALERELAEEVGIIVKHAKPLIKLEHSYPHKTVILDTWLVSSFEGKATGKEGQQITWQHKTKLLELAIPEVNKKIVSAIRLSIT